MNLSSKVLKERAKVSLKQDLGAAMAVYIIYMTIISVSTVPSAISNAMNVISSALDSQSDQFGINFLSFSITAPILTVVLSGFLSVGMARFYLNLADRKKAQISDLFSQIPHFGNVLVYMLLSTIFIFLWSLLFLVPGIIAALGYAMAPYILAEHPEISAPDALKMSKQMMKGNKGKLFRLQLSFIGLSLLCVLTFGIGYLFLFPYMQASVAEFFNEVSGKNIEKMQMAAAYGEQNINGTCNAQNNDIPTEANEDNSTREEL